MSSIGKISENRFARADLEHTLLCVDDDMRMEALRQTNYVKSIVTAQGQIDLERKGKQSYQGWMYARLLAFMQALYDRSDFEAGGTHALKTCTNLPEAEEITNAAGRRVWGFFGIEAIARPNINGFSDVSEHTYVQEDWR